MPRGDRTGPDGRGPMTGRRAGYCAGSDVPGYANDTTPRMGMGWRRGGGGGRGRGGGGWGRGGGRGYGRGFGYGYGYPVSPVHTAYPARDIPPPAQVQPVDEVCGRRRLDLKVLVQQVEDGFAILLAVPTVGHDVQQGVVLIGDAAA